jgi:hypothetical protein
MNKIIITTSLLMLSFVAKSNEYPQKLEVNKYDNIELSINDKKYTSIAKKAFYSNESLEALLDTFNKSISSCVQQNEMKIKNNKLNFSMKFNNNKNKAGYYNIYSSPNSKKYILEGIANYNTEKNINQPMPNKYLCEISKLTKTKKSIELFIN